MKNQPAKVFVVEDNLIYQNLLTYDISATGFDVTAFTNGEDAIALLHQLPDVVVLDYKLSGGMNGMDVLKAIKSINPSIQVIILSAQSDLEVAINTLKYGAFDYVEKTDSAPTEIINIINRFISIKSEAELLLKRKAFARKSLFMTGLLALILTGVFTLLL